MTLGSTQALTERVPEVLFGGKGGRSLGLTSLPPSYADCLEIMGTSISWTPKVLYKYCFAFKAARVRGMVMLTILYLSHFPT